MPKKMPCEKCSHEATFDYGTASLDGSPFEELDDVEAVEYYSCPRCKNSQYKTISNGDSL